MTVEVREHQKTPLWRNAQFLKWAVQLFVLGVFVAVGAVLVSRALENFSTQGTNLGWGWLTDPSDFLVREGIDLDPDSGIRALTVGAINTLRVTFFGIIGASIIGTLVGVGRLSKNWIVNKLSTIYVETIRNVPLLVQIFFWNAIAITLPDFTQDDIGQYWFKAANKGFGIAWVSWRTGFLPWLVFLIAGLFAARFVSRRRMRHQEETGQPARSGTFAFLAFAVFAVVGWFAWPILSFLGPVFEAIGEFIGSLPPIVIPLVVAVIAVGAAALWIRHFFESRRTPAGFGKLTDDDWFRVIFAAVAGVAIAVIAFVLSGIQIETVAGQVLSFAELIQSGIVTVFNWLARSFSGEGSQPLYFSLAEVAQRGNFEQYGTTGAVMTVPFFAIWFGVTIYTAAFIAEIVRGGILAVPLGQTEAAQAMGLKRSQYLRLVVLPQAFRIILPPLGNQYLNLFKNTSLGTAVAFAEIVAVGQTILNKTGQTLPVVLVWMGFFLTGSLTISAVVNYYNRKLRLVER